MKNLVSYKKNLILAYKNLDLKKIEKIKKIIIQKIKDKKQIFVCGNGGSASIANHFLCDFNKGVKISSKNKLKPKVISLSNNIETITAISNDINFNEIFKSQLDTYSDKGDLLITLSCSGSSKNIISAIKYAKIKKLSNISFTGFAQKNIIKLSDINYNLGIKNYGISEDVFQSVMHMISQSIRLRYISKKNKKLIL